MSERSSGPLAVQVTCYAGYRGEESPRSFTLDGRRIEVVEILERWRESKGAGPDVDSGGLFN